MSGLTVVESSSPVVNAASASMARDILLEGSSASWSSSSLFHFGISTRKKVLTPPGAAVLTWLASMPHDPSGLTVVDSALSCSP